MEQYDPVAQRANQYAPATVTINGSILTIDPNANFVGSFFITVLVNDGQGGTDSEQFRVRVT